MKIEKIKDALYAFVVGDALGVPVECCSRDEVSLHPVTDMIGFGAYKDIPEGAWSDDTCMTLATIDSLINTKTINYKDMADRFWSWLSDAKYTSTNVVFGVGRTTSVSLNNYKNGKIDATHCGGTQENNNGNGSLMRILPIALYCYKKQYENSKIIEIVKKTSSITHGHEISIMGCYIYVQYVINLLNGKNKIESYQSIQKLDYSMFQKSTQKVYQSILKGDISSFKKEKIQSSGYVVHSLEASLWCLLTQNNFKDTLLTAVNLGNDTNTIGAITGALAGLVYSFDTIPKDWIEKLKHKDFLDEYIKKFCNVLK